MKKIIFLIIINISVTKLIIAQTIDPTRIYTSDIHNFWMAYDSINKIRDTSLQKNIIQEIYMDKASSGLKEFMVSRQHSARRHLLNIQHAKKFWPSLRPLTLKIDSQKKDILKVMKQFQRIYPDFHQPDIYFTIGCLNSGGTTGPGMVLIGTEIAAADNSVDASEVGSWLRGVFKTNKSVVYLVAHELGHTQQHEDSTDENYDLLAYSLMEGSCDFIAELLLNEPIRAGYIDYGLAHEKRLWKDFQKEMDQKELKNWLYNGDKAPHGIADLGYFFGYRISKSYYSKAADKHQALKDILNLRFGDKSLVREFLKKSGYPISIQN